MIDTPDLVPDAQKEVQKLYNAVAARVKKGVMARGNVTRFVQLGMKRLAFAYYGLEDSTAYDELARELNELGAPLHWEKFTGENFR